MSHLPADAHRRLETTEPLALKSNEGLGPLVEAAGMVNFLDHGAASHVSSEGCHGVTQEHLERFAALLLAAERERCAIAVREWAVSRWRAEVENRPLENKNRRPLDDAWRQVMRYAGLDPDEVVGPSHDELVASRGA